MVSISTALYGTEAAEENKNACLHLFWRHFLRLATGKPGSISLYWQDQLVPESDIVDPLMLEPNQNLASQNISLSFITDYPHQAPIICLSTNNNALHSMV